MAKFLALTSKGLGNALSTELNELGVKTLKVKLNGVLFESSWSKLYEAHFYSRIATRFLLPVLDFAAYNKEDLYFNAKKHDFTKYLSPDQSFKVVAKLKNPGPFRHQVYLSQLFKDVIVDQFYEKYSKRPDVDKEDPAVQFFIKVDNTKVSISVDTTGDTLTKRGYRIEQGEAPMREHLAAGLLKLAGWKGDRVFLDPMCGSGTLVIEAAMMMLKQSFSTERAYFSFENFQGFKPEEFNEARKKYTISPASDKPMIIGYDQDPRMVEMAKKNVKAAGLDNHIRIRQMAVKDLRNDFGTDSGVIMTNPPYGVRLNSEPGKVEQIYTTFSDNLKENFGGWDLWLLSGNADMTKYLHMKSNASYKVHNGSLECRWLNYKIK